MRFLYVLALLLGALVGAQAVLESGFSCSDPDSTDRSYKRYHCRWNDNGQPVCADLATASPSLGEAKYGIRINTPATKSEVSGFTVEVTPNADTPNAEYDRIFAWNANYEVDVIMCKAGSGQSIEGGAFYIYELTAGAKTSETVTISCPADKDISHLDMCSKTGIGQVESTDPTSPCDTVQCPTTAPPGYDCANVAAEGACVVEEKCPIGSVCLSTGNPGVWCAYKATTKDAGSACRAAAGMCDEPEVCTGNSLECPADALKGHTFTCRDEHGSCDVAETCDGVSPDCPNDVFRAEGTVCDATIKGLCDLEDTCTGSSPFCFDEIKPAGFVCRPQDISDGSCDVDENCDGNNVACPVDVGLTSFGMTYKCANDIFLAGGLDESDLMAGKNSNKYFAGDSACNIGANKKTTLYEGTAGLTFEGCAPALCPNNRGLSNMVWGTCQLNANNEWRWACGGKLENGPVTEPLCPAGGELSSRRSASSHLSPQIPSTFYRPSAPPSSRAQSAPPCPSLSVEPRPVLSWNATMAICAGSIFVVMLGSWVIKHKLNQAREEVKQVQVEMKQSQQQPGEEAHLQLFGTVRRRSLGVSVA